LLTTTKGMERSLKFKFLLRRGLASAGKGMWHWPWPTYDGDGLRTIVIANDNEPELLIHNLGGGKTEGSGQWRRAWLTNGDGRQKFRWERTTSEIDGDGFPIF